ncbi:RanGTP-binding protein-domain-containing protein [Blastocladiella britannica]|nr:RanGTP-binding protein-domain-containing protein [Blastocladiella britannica]
MDDLFSKLAVHAVTVVGKAAFGMAVNKAVGQLTQYAKSSRASSEQPSDDTGLLNVRQRVVAEDESDPTSMASIRAEFERLDELRGMLQQKIAILTPSIDMIQVVCAKSNNLGLQAVLVMAGELNREMDALSLVIASTLAPSDHRDDAADENVGASVAPLLPQSHAEMLQHARDVTARVQRILDKIEDSVPYINLALAISGVNLTTGPSASGSMLPGGGVPLHTLLNASNLVAAAEPDAHATSLPVSGEWLDVVFPCRVYTLFRASVRADGLDNWTWKLEHLVSHLRIWRALPGASAITDQDLSALASRLVAVETTGMPDEPPGVLSFDLGQLKAMFFTATSRLLNIPDANPGQPVLVLHLSDYVAIEVITAQELSERDDSDESSELDEDDDDDDSALPTSAASTPARASRRAQHGSAIGTPRTPRTSRTPAAAAASSSTAATIVPGAPGLTIPPPSSQQHPPALSHHLALLETTLRLLALEHTLGASHLSIPDDQLWAHLSSDQVKPNTGFPLPTPGLLPMSSPAPASPSPSTTSSRRARASRRTAAAAAASVRQSMGGTSLPSTPTTHIGQDRRATKTGAREGSEERTPAPDRALNLMGRFLAEAGGGKQSSSSE